MLIFYDKPSIDDDFICIGASKIGCWIHAEKASYEDLKQIGILTGLDSTILHDSVDRYELPRIEKADNNLLVFTRHPVEQERHLYTSTLTIILTPNYFITISPAHNRFIEQILQKKHLIASLNHSEWMLHILLYITQEFESFIRKTRHSLISKEKEMSSVTSEDIYSLTKYEEILNQYLSSLDSFHLALEKLFKLESTAVYTQDREHVEDLLNAVKQSETLCETIIKNIRSLRDSYQIIFANNLTKTIKLLTGLTIVFTIPNIVSGIYGMNIKLPIAEHPHAFTILLFIMFILSAACGCLFYRKKWM